MDLEVWILPNDSAKFRVLFSTAVGCGVYAKSTCNPRPTFLDVGQKIKFNNKNCINSLSFLVVNEVGIFFVHPNVPHHKKDFPPMIGLHISFVKSLDARILVCPFEPNIDMPVATARFWWPTFSAENRNLGTSIQWLSINKRYLFFLKTI